MNFFIIKSNMKMDNYGPEQKQNQSKLSYFSRKESFMIENHQCHGGKHRIPLNLYLAHEDEEILREFYQFSVHGIIN